MNNCLLLSCENQMSREIVVVESQHKILSDSQNSGFFLSLIHQHRKDRLSRFLEMDAYFQERKKTEISYFTLFRHA